MEEWTFLLQKDGDRSWLPLDSPDVEILEGRYRIVVQTDRPSADINIRICHLATAEDPPKRRIQKRSNRTNNNGLMVVSPFTQLQPGNWELSCFLTDPMSDLLGDTLHHAVRLRVFAQAEDEVEVWEPAAEPTHQTIDSVTNLTPQPVYPSEELAASVTPDHDLVTSSAAQDLATLNVEIAQALGFSMDRLVEMTDQLSHQLVEEIFREFRVPVPAADAAIATDATPTPPAPELPSAAALDIRQVQIVLTQDSWLAARGDQLMVSGQLTLAAEASELPSDLLWDGLEPDLEGAVPQEIQLQLRDPQTSKVLFHACQLFPLGAPPLAFNFLCSLPEDLTTHLLVGEVSIAGALPGAENVLVTLKTCNFSVTVDPQGLVDELQKVKTALAAAGDDDEVPDLVAQLSDRLMRERVRQSLDLSFLNMAAPVTDESLQLEERSATKPAALRKQILPPLLHIPDGDQASQRKLELPTFVGGGTNGKSAIAAKPEVTLAMEPISDGYGIDDDVHQAQSPNSAIADSDIVFEIEEIPSTASAPSEQILSEPVEPQPSSKGHPDLSALDELSSPIRSAFQSLNLQDKFLTRLSSMATDAELTTLLKLTLPQSPTSDVASDAVGIGVEAAPLPVSDVVAELDTTEVVVDDDPSWREWVKRAGSRVKSNEPVVVEPPAANPLMLSPDAPVPLPQLELGIDDIVAGRPINVRVRLPNLLPKIYVKLWVNDRQTRLLLDGPRWLVDFLPNGFDELEASTQLTAPFGSTHIRLEAIAVEIHTQRESQKVSLDCEVIPAELPDDLFEDLDY